ncbi:MAG: hypothetical protein H0W05_05885 [Thermoleophilaceae bacterium]|nr:hypothetical protein [Thermoleophilaceae bacterium]
MTAPTPFTHIVFDGRRLTLDRRAEGRRLRADPRCFDAPTVVGAYAHVCALPDRQARLPFDTTEVQQARRDALASWIPRLGDSFVCLTTLAVDAVDCGGAITVARDPAAFASDPFARLFPGTVVETDLFTEVQPPAGPVIERYAGTPWPGGGF